jgi:cbb3-type cytochrome oxidase maturation protein
MEVLFVLIPVSIALAAASVAACLYAIRGGQFDDLESPPWRILFEDRTSDAKPLVSGAAFAERKPVDAKLRTNVEANEKPLSAIVRRSAPL